MNQRRRLIKPSSPANPVVAVLMTAALGVTAVFGGNAVMNTQSLGGGSIEVQSSSASLADGENVVIDDAAVATQGEGDAARTVKEFTRDEKFSQFALTWQGDADFAAFVRAQRDNGQWSEWYVLDPIEQENTAVNGTELIYIEPTDRVQVNVSNVDLVTPGSAAPAAEAAVEIPAEEAPVEDAPAEQAPAEQAPVEESPAATPLPTNHGDIQPVVETVDAPAEAPAENAAPAGATTAANIDAVFIDGGSGTTGEIAPTSTDGMPQVISRSGWGANEGIRCSNPTYTDPVKAVTVHHTAGSNNYTEAQAAGQVRGIYDYHARQLGWCDVGYNAMVDKYGNIYEGRYGGLDRAVQGAHVGGFNKNTWGISVLGNYETAAPTQASLQAVGDMAGWRLAQVGQDPNGQSYLSADFNFSGSKYSTGQGANFPNINAHRDFHFNACPGGNLYAQMGTIRSIATAKYNSIQNGTAVTPDPGTTDPGTPEQPPVDSDETPAPGTTPGDSAPGDNEGTVNNPDGTTTNVTNNGSNAASSADTVSGLLAGDPAAIATAAGTVAGTLILLAASNGSLPGEATTVADVELVPGLTVATVAPYIGTILSVTGNDEYADLWAGIEPALGASLGTTTGVGGAQYSFYEEGLGVYNPEAGTAVALLGPIADAWLQQGLDLGPLGLPVADQYAANNGDMRVDFQGGSISYNAETNTVDINVN
ncbi:N-acetylmuramoyl-L-alanine amidase [Corynebacterium lubricantis]|uniref:N-acetylmuramoyl-L-alanine amidase n=1 Tax=Corynebacterium lubricantis TaxID=541095 RepID=UPI00047598C2|nr:N-acetylmuramoyl-L-alanine amidase [Corynebacterium lubricantis]